MDKSRYLIFLSFIFLFLGCGGGHVVIGSSHLPAEDIKTQERLMAYYEKWKSTPHKMGGMSRSGVDCSGFVYQLYKTLFDIRLPRTTKGLFSHGYRIRKSRLRPGDIVLFSPPTYPRHVGIYVGDHSFIHASKSAGVTISSLDNRYWKRYYYSARRILDL